MASFARNSLTRRVSLRLAAHWGKTEAHARVQAWSQQALQEGRLLGDIAQAAVNADGALAGAIAPSELAALCDVDAVAHRAGRLVQPQIESLRERCRALSAPQR